MSIKAALFVILGSLSSVYVLYWLSSMRALRRSRSTADATEIVGPPTLVQTAIGFVTNFFDTLGIGSFATTTSAFKLLRVVPDERIPGTLIAGHALPVVTQAFIFISVIRMDPVTLVALIAASLAGGWLGAGVVAGLPRRALQIGMGIALLTAALFLVMSQFGLFPGGGASLDISGVKLGVALVVNFILGALLTLGIGNYGPSLVLFSLLGMDPRAAFPVMMGSGAFVATLAGIRFVRRRRYHVRAALGLISGGIPAVLIAGLLVRSLPLAAVRWVVIVVVAYTAVAMLRSAVLERRSLLAKSTPGVLAAPRS